MKKVLIFGVFDGVHDGHREFIRGARAHGDQLVGIVARDEVVERLKGHKPEYSQAERISMLLSVPEIDLAYLGDGEEGTYKILKEVDPDVVYLGYDQTGLHEDLKKAIVSSDIRPMELVVGVAYKPEELHSSVLKGKDK